MRNNYPHFLYNYKFFSHAREIFIVIYILYFFISLHVYYSFNPLQMYIVRFDNPERNLFYSISLSFRSISNLLNLFSKSKFSKRSIKRSKSTSSVYPDQKRHRASLRRKTSGGEREKKEHTTKMKSALTRVSSRKAGRISYGGI